VRGLWLGGSIARGDDGPFSDVDLFVGANDPFVDELFAERRELAARIGPILASYERTRIRDYIVLYDGEIRFEYIFCSIDGLEVDPVRETQIRILYDPDGRLKDYDNLLSKHVGQPGTIAPGDLEDRLNWLFVNFWYIYSRINQGSFWEAFDRLNDVRTEIVKLARVERNLEPNKYHKLEELFPQCLLSDLSRTLSNTNANNLAAALLQSIGIFSKIAKKLCGTCQLEYPGDLDRMIRKRLYGLPRKTAPS
jgi:predicted nucleotidyltransferase